jgi:hypothetical protein
VWDGRGVRGEKGVKDGFPGVIGGLGGGLGRREVAGMWAVCSLLRGISRHFCWHFIQKLLRTTKKSGQEG